MGKHVCMSLVLVAALGAAIVGSQGPADPNSPAQVDTPSSNVLSFDGLIVDDFESYTDDEGNRISQAWLEWKIPLSSFKGVSLSKVKKLCIGVGGRMIPVPSGSGRIYIDDITLSNRPA